MLPWLPKTAFHGQRSARSGPVTVPARARNQNRIAPRIEATRTPASAAGRNPRAVRSAPPLNSGVVTWSASVVQSSQRLRLSFLTARRWASGAVIGRSSQRICENTPTARHQVAASSSDHPGVPVAGMPPQRRQGAAPRVERGSHRHEPDQAHQQRMHGADQRDPSDRPSAARTTP